MVFAASLVPAMLMIGAAYDYSQAGRLQTSLRDTLDAAAVTAALAHARADRDQEARNMAKANAVSRLKGATLGAVKVEYNDAQQTVKLTADVEMKSAFMKLAGIDKLSVRQSSTAVWGAPPNRISLVLDTTGSLRRAGVDADLRSAATNFIDIISGGKSTSTGMYVALVPFASMVNVGPDKVNWLSPKYNSADYLPGRWDGCVYERALPNDISLSPPVPGEFEAHLWPKNYTAAFGFNDWAGAPASEFRNGVRGAFPDEGGLPPLGPNVGCMAPVIPLTTDMNAIKSRIADLEMLSASGGTVLTTGLAWGWRMLSPDWAPFWRNGGTLQPQDKESGGTMVFLSDGANDWVLEDQSRRYGLAITGFGRPEERRTGYGPLRSSVESAAATLGTTVNDPQLAAKIADDEADPKKRKVFKAIEDEQRGPERDAEKLWDDRFAELCETIKKSGITLYTISFGPDNGNVNLLMKCATSKDHYFRSPSRTDLEKAFQQIAGGLGNKTTARLVK